MQKYLGCEAGPVSCVAYGEKLLGLKFPMVNRDLR